MNPRTAKNLPNIFGANPILPCLIFATHLQNSTAGIVYLNPVPLLKGTILWSTENSLPGYQSRPKQHPYGQN